MRKFVLLFIVILMTACSPVQVEVEPSFCSIDSDCVVKNVGNCCGYFPKCVNAEHEPDLDKVREACAEEEIASVCGWQEIESCECVENTCEDIYVI